MVQIAKYAKQKQSHLYRIYCSISGIVITFNLLISEDYSSSSSQLVWPRRLASPTPGLGPSPPDSVTMFAFLSTEISISGVLYCFFISFVFCAAKIIIILEIIKYFQSKNTFPSRFLLFYQEILVLCTKLAIFVPKTDKDNTL